MHLKSADRHRRRDDSGASAAEYALLISLIALIIIAGVTLFGNRVERLFSNSCDEVASATSGSSC